MPGMKKYGSKTPNPHYGKSRMYSGADGSKQHNRKANVQEASLPSWPSSQRKTGNR